MTLSSIQAMTWKVTDKNNCVTYTDNHDGTLTVTVTGNKGVATFQPVLLDGYKNMAISIHFSDGFVSEATIVRTDGKPWTYSSKVTIGGEEYNVFEMVQGEAVSIKAQTANDITHDYDGWMYTKRNDSETNHAAVSPQGKNGATFDLSVLKPGLYGIIGRVPTYEQDYIIEPLGKNRQDSVKTDTLYVRVKEKPAIVPGSGDITGDGKADSDDAVLVLQFTAGSANLTSEQIAAADLTGDGKVDTDDAVLILQRSAGLAS